MKPIDQRKILAEFLVLFIALPLALFLFPAPRFVLFALLASLSAYALYHLHHQPHFSWHTLWHGQGWRWRDRRKEIFRFALLLFPLIALTWYMVPERFFRFPLDRPALWFIVMLLYPLLSALPQELIFRSFFFSRYQPLFTQRWVMIGINAFCFGWLHIIMHNWVAPLLSLVGGFMFAHSYSEHRSLKWVVIEHSLYGCVLFTLGLGWYFVNRVVR